MAELIRVTEGFSCADIECSIKDLAQQALLYGDGVVTKENLLERLSSIVPFAGTNPDVVKQLRNWGRERAVPASRDKREDSI